jgi:hypothetical protein
MSRVTPNPVVGWVGWAAASGFLLSFLLAAFLLYERVRFGVLADLDATADYRFGSDAMIGHGGAKYETAEQYAGSALIGGFAFLTILGVFAWSAAKRSALLLIAAWVLFVAALLLLD